MKLADIPPHITEVPGHPKAFWQAYRDAYGDSPDEDEIRPLWSLNYYDGPLSGIVICRGKYFYARHLYYMDRKWWAAWELTPDEWEREKANHEAFDKYVGEHTNYVQDEDENWVPNKRAEIRPREGMDAYYKGAHPKVDYSSEVETRDMFAILRNPFRNR